MHPLLHVTRRQATAGDPAARVSDDPAPPAAEPAAPPDPTVSRPPADALHQAARSGDLRALEQVLANAADVNAWDDRGWTALLHAASQGHARAVAALLEAGAGPDIRAPDGTTALFLAALHGHADVIDVLMQAGADIGVRGPDGRTAADVAKARYGDAGAARNSGGNAAVQALVQGLTIAEAEELARVSPPGTVFRDCGACPEMVVVPAGSFMMGSPASEEGRHDQEGPVHRVTMPEPFAVGTYEVTRGEFRRFVEATGHVMPDACWTPKSDGGPDQGRHWRRPGYTQTDRHPVVCVRWGDAQAYVRWLSRDTGRQYRLLSESEWEYAARAGSTTRYAWGDGVGRNRAHCGGCGSRRKEEATVPTGSFPPNAFGLHDMHGNAWEWVEDCWNDTYAGAPADGTAWLRGECDGRLLRGGSWYYAPGAVRSAYRFGVLQDAAVYDSGFRVARTLAP